jgi:hypothetical protein
MKLKKENDSYFISIPDPYSPKYNITFQVHKFLYMAIEKELDKVRTLSNGKQTKQS